jgi:hypothetical protein
MCRRVVPHRTDIMSVLVSKPEILTLTLTFFFLHVPQPPLDFLCGRFATKPALRRAMVGALAALEMALTSRDDRDSDLVIQVSGSALRKEQQQCVGALAGGTRLRA